jgi:colanic acid biosynthesis glycosyl transferase WcaI
MRVLIFTQHFPPEIMATGRRAASLAEGLSIAGHDVVVITGLPNHPASLGRSDFCTNAKDERKIGRYRVLRVPVYRSPDSRPLKRVLTYATFMISAAWRGLCARRPDVILAISPLPTGLAAVPARLWYGVPLVYDLQDIWPASAQSVEVLRQGLVLAALDLVERLFYTCCTVVVGITQGFKIYLASRGLPLRRLAFIPNGTDGRMFAQPPASVHLPESLAGKFVVGYIGNLGLAQGLEAALEAAFLLRNEAVSFLFVGDGVDKQRLLALARERQLDNIEFLEAVPHSAVHSILTACDALLVMLRKTPLFEITIPSKVYEYMGAGKPIVCSVAGETAALILETGCGLTAAPSDPEALAQAIRVLCHDPQLRCALGENGRRAALEKYSSRREASEYTRLLEKVVEEHSPHRVRNPARARRRSLSSP